jgi:glycopeptide antibiotics resistance protein
MGKILSRGLLAIYIAILIWLVLFKFSVHISHVFAHHHRSLNLIPFAAPSIVNGKINYGEMIYNCIFFIPLALLLDVNFKKIGFLPKLAFIMFFSLSAEIIQFIFAIGATDITDVITNTLGGFLGLKLYDLSNKYINTKKLDKVIVLVGILLFLVFVAIDVNHFVRSHKNEKMNKNL